MTIRSIPPKQRERRSVNYGINVYNNGKRPPHYTRMRASTLGKLLVEAERLEAEQREVVKLLSSDEELHKLDRLQYVVKQLGTQIELKRKLI